MYQTYNYFFDYMKKNQNIKNLEENYKKILICFLPVIPHFANECLLELNVKSKFSWPQYNESYIENDKINIVIQINGKKRAILNANKGIEEDEVIKIIKKEKIAEKYLIINKIKKIIFVKDRLLNILIDE